jgi:hypothetical protein
MTYEVVIGTWRSSVGPLGAVGRQRNDGGEEINFIELI